MPDYVQQLSVPGLAANSDTVRREPMIIARGGPGTDSL